MPTRRERVSDGNRATPEPAIYDRSVFVDNCKPQGPGHSGHSRQAQALQALEGGRTQELIGDGAAYALLVPVRVVLAEDNFIVRRGLVSVIESEPELDLVAACADLGSLLAAVSAQRPEVVLTDIRMPPTHTDEGIRAAHQFGELYPDMGVVLLSQYLEPDYALAFFEQGTERRAYLLKEHLYDPEHLLAAVATVAGGGSMIDPKVTESLVQDRIRRKRSPLSALTDREREVLSKMAQGQDNTAIAKCLFLSIRSVERHINVIFSKLALVEEGDVNRRVKAVLMLLFDET